MADGKYKVFNSVSDSALAKTQGTPSAKEPASEGSGLASYKDPWTGEVIYAESGYELYQLYTEKFKPLNRAALEEICSDWQSKKIGLESQAFKNEFLPKLNEKLGLEGEDVLVVKNFRNNAKNRPEEWFHLAFDLSIYGEDAAKAEEIITDTLVNGTNVYTQGGKLRGVRPVLKWPSHPDQERANHVHLWVHEGSLISIDLDGKKILLPEVKINFERDQADDIYNAIEKNLAEAGLKGVIQPPVAKKISTVDNPVVDKEDKFTAKQMLNGDEHEFDELSDLNNIKELTVDEAIGILKHKSKIEEEEFAKRVAELKARKEEIQMSNAVRKMAEDYRDIGIRLNNANHRINQLAKDNEAVVSLKQMLSDFVEDKYGIKIENEDDVISFIATHNTRLEELKQGHEAEVKELNDENEELNNLNTALSDFTHNKFNVSITSIEDIKKLDEAYENEVKAHKEELESLHLDLSNLEQFKDSISSIAKEKLGIEIESIRDLEQIGKKFDSLNDKLETLNTKLSDADIENKNLNKKLETYEKLNDGLVEEKTTLEVENKTLKGNIVAKDKEIESLNKKHEKDLEQLKTELRAEFEKELKAKTEEAVKSAVKSEEEAHAKTKKTLTGITEKFQELKKAMEEKKDNDVENKNQPKKPKI
ncbi:hypothetical protein ACFW7X_004452 [Salmonella enterica]